MVVSLKYINWQTAAEINNDYFTIERSENTKYWEEVTRVKGGGNSSIPQSYSRIDSDPYKGLSYYRLKQADFNGDFEYFMIRSVIIDNGVEGIIKIYPNPSKGYITIEGDEEE